MKGLIVLAAFVTNAVAWAAPHPASTFVEQTLNRGKAILEIKNDNNRLAELCRFGRQKLNINYIHAEWLGNYANLSRDRAAISEFKTMIPAIIITKIGMGSGGTLSGDFTVSPNATDKGNGFFSVGVKIVSGSGNTYNVKVIVLKSGSNYRIVDGQYMGYSAIDYQGRDFQKTLNDEYNRNPNTSKPVTALVNQIEGDANYVACP